MSSYFSGSVCGLNVFTNPILGVKTMQRINSLFGAITAILAAWFLICGVATSAEPTGILRAGVAKTDITPAKPVMLAGYGSRRDLSQGVHDRLSARVVAFEQDGKRLVLVSTDLLGFYGGSAESVRKAILEACRLQPSELFLTAIHTHAAPTISLRSEMVPASNVEYTKTLETQLVAACCRSSTRKRAGYVPTKEAYPEGGYEVQTSPFAPEAAEKVVQGAVRLLREL